MKNLAKYVWNDVLQYTPFWLSTSSNNGLGIYYHTEEDEKSLKIKVSMPGIKKEDASLFVREGYLILGVKDRELVLSWNVDKFKVEEASAALQDGLLSIEIPREEIKIVKIDIQ